MKNLFVTIFLILGITVSFAQTNKNFNKLPIIDMHLHSNDQLWSKSRICFPEPCEKAPTLAKNVSELLPKTIEQMNKYNIVLGALSGSNYNITKTWGEEDSRFYISPFIGKPEKVDFKNLEKNIIEGKIKILGEVTSQYYGYSMNDPALDTIFSIAVKHDLPILVHSAGLGGTPHFPIQKGNPLMLNDVIRKHPKLRVYIENAAWPFGDEVISLMYVNPNVYVDLSTITWIIPRKTFHSYLKKLINAGLGKRLMFGSDQMIWPEVIGLAIDSINTAEFLTEQQKRDIFYNNAARFLRLPAKQIHEHHKNVN